MRGTEVTSANTQVDTVLWLNFSYCKQIHLRKVWTTFFIFVNAYEYHHYKEGRVLISIIIVCPKTVITFMLKTDVQLAR